MSLPDIPLNYVVPFAASALAYLNARWSLSYDAKLIGSLVKTIAQSRYASWKGRVNLFYVLEQHAQDERTKDHPFVVYNGRTWTFYETYLTAMRYGTWLKTVHGVKAKEIVAIDFMNSSTFVFMLLGLWSIGAVPAFINYNLTGKPLTHSVRVSTARLMLVDEELREKLTPEIMEQFGAEDFRQEKDGKGPVQVLFFTPEVENEVLKTPATREDDAVLEDAVPRDMALLIYTSGTTGLPKPAIVGWIKCWMGSGFTSGWLRLNRDDRFFTCMPLYHSSAAILGLMSSLMAGSTIIIGRKFSARSFWKDVCKNEATVVQYVGETMRYILAVPPNKDPATGEDFDKKHNVRIIFGNGLRPDIWNQVKERFNVPTVAEFYAATEGTSGSWNISSNDFSAGAIGRNGVVFEKLFGRGIAVVDVDHESQEPWRDPETGFCRKVPRGEPGELLYAIDAADPAERFQGYFRNSKATETKIMRNVLKEGDAYFRTGDMVRWDAEGRWYFSDRLGDTFRWKSENVSTSEVGGVIGAHPAVHEANVYGVALPNHDGRAGCAALVFQHQIEANNTTSVIEPPEAVLESLAKHALANLPRFAAPLFLRVTPEMPGTGNNKQQKHVLRSEGVDPGVVKGDRLYWLQGEKYVPFEMRDWKRIQGGDVKL